MTKPSESVTLYGDRADQFREIRGDLEDRLGHEPTNAQVIGLLMSAWSPEAALSPDSPRSR